jgi:hypothetical protein
VTTPPPGAEPRGGALEPGQASPAAREITGWHGALGIIGVATLLRLIVGARLPLVPDETYYWEWSRHLSFGYFDHPPLVAWLIRIGTLLFGESPFGVRILNILAGTVAAVSVAATTRRVAGAKNAAEAALIMSVMPLAAAGLVLATPDAALFAALSVVIYCLVRALQSAPGSAESFRAWRWAGVALGFAFWSKYTSILLPIGVVIAFASHRKLWPRFREPGPYMACAIAALIFTPVLIWNARHEWISFTWQLQHGLGAEISLLRALRQEGEMLAGQMGLTTPILFVLIAVSVGVLLRGTGDAIRWMLAVVATLYFGFFVYSALKKPVEPNWPAPAYIGAIVLCAAHRWGETAKRWRAAGIAFAGVLSIAITLHGLRPVLPIVPAKDPVGRAFGWSDLAAAADRAATAPKSVPNAVAWLAADRYQEASELSFWAQNRPETFALNLGGRRNQYDLWPKFADRARPGDRLVVVLDETLGVHDAVVTLMPYFDSVLRGDVVELKRGDAVIALRRIYTLDGWRGGWPGDQ